MSELPILVINSGSSSIKFSIFQATRGEEDGAFRRRG